jgi:BirA family biotin operon repressor/biotin-[acetyl-CoA-carboxylase] ligase
MLSGYNSSISNNELSTLNNKTIGKKILHFKILDSTNQYALDMIKEDISEGTVILSDVQTKGKGRKKRFWYSPKGGLWFSVILYPKIHTDKSMLITMTASVSISEAIKQVTRLDTEIKWPNDILLHKKKLCGILTELESDKDYIKYAIIGIGINVNNKINVELKETAISIKDAKGIEIPLMDLFYEILKRFDNNYNYLKTKKFEKIRNSWFSLSNIVGQRVEIKQEDKIIHGEVCDIDENGHLIVQTINGKERFNVGDIKYL